jgi:hypothetical protein
MSRGQRDRSPRPIKNSGKKTMPYVWDSTVTHSRSQSQSFLVLIQLYISQSQSCLVLIQLHIPTVANKTRRHSRNSLFPILSLKKPLKLKGTQERSVMSSIRDFLKIFPINIELLKLHKFTEKQTQRQPNERCA